MGHNFVLLESLCIYISLLFVTQIEIRFIGYKSCSLSFFFLKIFIIFDMSRPLYFNKVRGLGLLVFIPFRNFSAKHHLPDLMVGGGTETVITN